MAYMDVPALLPWIKPGANIEVTRQALLLLAKIINLTPPASSSDTFFFHTSLSQHSPSGFTQNFLYKYPCDIHNFTSRRPSDFPRAKSQERKPFT